MNRNLMEAIRQQSDDLRDELKELEQWEEEVHKKTEAKKTRSVPVSAGAQGAVEPPVRGTVPSIKQAMADEAKKQGKQLPPEQDPIQLAKENGNELFRVGKTNEAVEAYSSGIDMDPNSPSTHVLYGNRAMCHIKLGEWESAERDASMCVQLNRGYAKGYFRRGVARKNLGKLKEARADLESVLALVPNDASALAELEEVTKKLQAQRANTATAAAPRKKIVIEEVDDEDDEDEGGETAEASAARAADDAARDARIQKQLAELEHARRRSEEAKQAEMVREEKSMEARRRHNPRVEIIEEEEEAPAKPAESVKPTAAPTKTEPVRRHADPAPALDISSGKKEGPSGHAKKGTKTPPAAPVRVRALPPKESLKQPKSFSDFERDYSLIEKDDELRNHYVGLLNPSSLASLFGSSMTPEMLSGVLRSVKAMPATEAMLFMKGLSRVNRVGELAMFFNDDEEQVVEDVAALVKSSGAPAAEATAAMKPFKSF